jgi:hypothetical protein
MALIDRLKYDGPGGQAPWLVYKHPSDNLVLGTQLIVNKSQEAIFFKGGNALDVFGPGTHTLAAGNIPLLQKLVNLPFGGKTPFTAEVYYINKAAKLDLKWGTPDAFQVTEPRYHIIVNVRAYGQFGVKIADGRNFTTQIVGALHGDDVFAYDKVASYIQGSGDDEGEGCHCGNDRAGKNVVARHHRAFGHGFHTLQGKARGGIRPLRA